MWKPNYHRQHMTTQVIRSQPALLPTDNLVLKIYFHTSYVCPTIHLQHLQIALCKKRVWKREIKPSAIERVREGVRRAQFNLVLGLSTLSSSLVRNQRQESGIKRFCTERRSRNGSLYSPPTLSVSHAPAPALAFFHWLSLWILSNNSHSGEWGGIPALSLRTLRIRSPPWLDLNACALILPPGLRNDRWLINASWAEKWREVRMKIDVQAY